MPSPPRPPQLLPGRAAVEYTRTGYRMLIAALAVTGLVWLASFLPEPLRQIVGLPLVVAGMRCGWVLWRAAVEGSRMAKRETQAGYTTNFNVHPSLWQLDPSTGAVIRPPRGVELPPVVGGP
jgi:hypothetical protein